MSNAIFSDLVWNEIQILQAAALVYAAAYALQTYLSIAAAYRQTHV